MVEVRLHGPLAQQFGMVWNLDIRSPHEAVAAIEANKPGFRKAINDLADKGIVFRVRTKSHDFDNDDVMTSLGGNRRVDFIPIVAGSSKGIRFVVGAVLTAVGVYFNQSWLVAAGVSMMLGAVVEWLTPQPKKEDFKNGLQSWTLGGPANTADQGQPVPIIYGEVLAGGYPISAGLSVSQLDAAGSNASSVSIGGNLDVAYGVASSSNNEAVLQLSGGAFNLDDPYTYTWSYSGFAGATVTNEGLNTATLRLHVHVTTVPPDTQVQITGNVTLQMTGYKPGTRGAEDPVEVTVSVTKAVSATFTGPHEGS